MGFHALFLISKRKGGKKTPTAKLRGLGWHPTEHCRHCGCRSNWTAGWETWTVGRLEVRVSIIEGKTQKDTFFDVVCFKGSIIKESGRPQPVKIDASCKPSESPGTVWSLPLLCRVNITSFNDQHQLNSQESFFWERLYLFMSLHLNKSCAWFPVSGFYLQISEAVKHLSRLPAHKGRHRMISDLIEWSRCNQRDGFGGKGEGDHDLSLDLWGIRYTVTHTHTDKHSLYQRNMDLLWTIANMMQDGLLPEHFWDFHFNLVSLFRKVK